MYGTILVAFEVPYTTFPELGHGLQPNLPHTEAFWAWLASFKRQKPAQ